MGFIKFFLPKTCYVSRTPTSKPDYRTNDSKCKNNLSIATPLSTIKKNLTKIMNEKFHLKY